MGQRSSVRAKKALADDEAAMEEVITLITDEARADCPRRLDRLPPRGGAAWPTTGGIRPLGRRGRRLCARRPAGRAQGPACRCVPAPLPVWPFAAPGHAARRTPI